MPEQIDHLVADEVTEAFSFEDEKSVDEVVMDDVREEPAVPVEPVAPVAVEPVEAASEIAEGETTEQPVVEPAHDWEKRYKALQSHKDKQIAETNAQLDAYKQLIEGISQPAPEQAPAPPEVTPEDLEAGVKSAPVDTFQWTMMNRPDMISTVISKIREHHGNELGDEAMVAYQQASMAYQQQAIQQAQQEQYHQLTAPAQITGSLEQGVAGVAQHYGEDFTRLAERTNEILQQHTQELQDFSPQSVQQFVERHFLTAYREDLQSKAVKPQGPTASSPADAVEMGTPGAAPVVTASDDIGDSIVEAYKRTRVYE